MIDRMCYIDGVTHLDGVSLVDIAVKFGTPTYVYSRDTLSSRLKLFRTGMQENLNDMNFRLCYAVKACSSLAVLKIVANHGYGADVVSEGELRRCLIAGIPADRVVFSGVGKTEDELIFALKSGIYQFNVESYQELLLINKVAGSLSGEGITFAPVSLRINPDTDAGSHHKISTGSEYNKFGIPISQAGDIYRLASDMQFIKIVGVSVHIGSQITSVKPFNDAFTKIATFLREERMCVKTIDLGGGIGVNYDKDTSIFSLAEYAKVVKDTFSSFDSSLIFEPGRYIAADAAILLTKILYSKDVSKRHFLIVDAAMNDFMRPAMYDATHEVFLVLDPQGNKKFINYDIVGPVCESGDSFCKEYKLNRCESGDLIYFSHVGAYGSSMASEYNSRPLVAEVMVSDGKAYLVRRRPSYDEMFALESILE